LDNIINHKIRSELDTVYITSDGRKFLKYIDALYSQSEIDKGIEIKLSKQARVMDIVKIVMDVLKHENWGVYYKNQPMQPLEMQDGNPLYKINLVDDDDIERALINTLTKGESWKHSETNLNQKKT
jgi:hypothetical protein